MAPPDCHIELEIEYWWVSLKENFYIMGSDNNEKRILNYEIVKKLGNECNSVGITKDIPI